MFILGIRGKILDNRSSTHSTSPIEPQNTQKTKLYKACARSQWNNKWSTIAPLHLHIEHWSTSVIPFFMILSLVKIFTQAAVHTKNAFMQLALKPWHIKCFSVENNFSWGLQNSIVWTSIKLSTTNNWCIGGKWFEPRINRLQFPVLKCP